MGVGVWIVVGIVIFILVALLAIIITKYRTAGPDEALIVTGSYLGGKNVHVDDAGNKIKIIRGGGAFYPSCFSTGPTIKPFIEQT